MDKIHSGNEFALLAKCILAARGAGVGAATIADSLGLPARRVASVLKAAVGAGSVSNPTWAGALVEYRQIEEGFIESLRARSVFIRLLQDGMRRAPLLTRLAISTLALNARAVAEGKPKPVGRLTLAEAQMQSMKAAALIVVTNEVVISASPAALELLNTELRNGVSAAVDGQFFGAVIDGSTPTVASSGMTAAAIATDLRALLMIVNTTGAGRLFWASSAGVANGLSTVTGTDGKLAFPTVTPEGGELLGLPYLVTDQTGAADNLVLIDATGIAGDLQAIVLSQTEQAAIQMDDDPADPGPGVAMVSLFQTNSRAIMAEGYFGVERFRTSAVARLTGIDWTP